MVFDLPKPDTTELSKPPLTLGVCQVRYEETLAVSDSKTFLAISSDLGGSSGPYPRSEPFKEASLTLALTSEAGEHQQSLMQTSGWRLLSEDGTWVVSITPEFTSLETTGYTTWDGDFRPRMGALLETIERHVAPQLEQRLGLRYIDKLTGVDVSEPSDWKNYIAPQMLGLLMHDKLGKAIVASQEQAELVLDEDVRVLLRHGTQRDPAARGALTYLIDCDVYRQTARSFDISSIKDALERFSEVALQLFQASLNPAYLATLR